MRWLIFALMTVVSWGLYGVFLHKGQGLMADPALGRYKAFFFVGIAYLLTAVIGSGIMLMVNGAEWTFPASGMFWSVLAGLVGAIGAFCVLLAFGAQGTPAVVMSIVFAGAPIMNAIVAIALHPPVGGLSALRWPFMLGIILAAVGGFLVSLYKP
jgi:drug/metabolite transporter (DMT)-like permease